MEKSVTVVLANGQEYTSKHGFTTTVRKVTEGAHIELLDGGRLFVQPEQLQAVVETA